MVIPDQNRTADRQRGRLLQIINESTEQPLLVLSLIWLVLLLLEFTEGLNRRLEWVVYAIWIIFIVDFLIEFTIAPRKLSYLRRNWLTLIALALPALRLIRILRVVRLIRLARAGRSLRLVRLITSLNRGLRALGQALARRGVGYVAAATILIILVGSAAMSHFESPESLRATGIEPMPPQTGLRSYAEAVWWTAMLLTTMGSEYWPKTAEGRILCWLLSLYAFTVFGYITATLASIIIGKEWTPDDRTRLTSELTRLRQELEGLRSQIDALQQQRPPAPPPPGASEQ